MDKHTVKAILQPHATELKNSGIQSLSLFGSVARGDATGQSDIDLMSDFERARRLTLFDFAGLELRLAEILQAPVDLCDRRMMKDEVRLEAEREAVIVF
jgi:predicted nucleotidyltransferase